MLASENNGLTPAHSALAETTTTIFTTDSSRVSFLKHFKLYRRAKEGSIIFTCLSGSEKPSEKFALKSSWRAGAWRRYLSAHTSPSTAKWR